MHFVATILSSGLLNKRGTSKSDRVQGVHAKLQPTLFQVLSRHVIEARFLNEMRTNLATKNHEYATIKHGTINPKTCRQFLKALAMQGHLTRNGGPD